MTRIGYSRIYLSGPQILLAVSAFLIVSRLAFMEVCHGYWGWQPGNIEWWITVLNLLGSIGFMISALYSPAVPPGESSGQYRGCSKFLVGSQY